MSKVASPWPRYRHHKPTGQAVVTLSGRDHYLGLHDTLASHLEYQRLLAEWLAAGRTPIRGRSQALTLVELAAAYTEWAKGYYVKDGEQTPMVGHVALALKTVCTELGYSRTPVSEFGPLSLQAIQARLAQTDRSRSYINKIIAIVKRMVRWGVSQELIEPQTFQALSTVGGLKQGRTTAREASPVGPVDDATVDATLPHLAPILADMVKLQRLLGCRPGEVCQMRPCDVDQTNEVWTYKPASHKTQRFGKVRAIPIGPKAQAILLPYLTGRPAEEYCFRPIDARTQRMAALRAARKTPVQPSQRDRSKAKPKHKPGNRYEKDAYNRAIARACERAGLPPWKPNQLRHAAATAIRREFGLEAAQVVLGHANAAVTQVYAERDFALAAAVALKRG